MAVTTCEYNRVWREGRDNRCGQTVGLRTWYDAAGLEHAACRSHWAVVEYRYPVADPPAKAERARFEVTDPRDTESWTAA